MDRGAWWATVHGVTESWTRLRTHALPLLHHRESEESVGLEHELYKTDHNEILATAFGQCKLSRLHLVSSYRKGALFIFPPPTSLSTRSLWVFPVHQA